MPPEGLLVEGEAAATVLLPAGFGRFAAERLLLAVADDADAVTSNTGLNKRVLDGIGAVLAEGEVVFVGSTLVAIAADDDLESGVASQIGSVFGERSLLIAANIVCVVVEENIRDVCLELF